MSRIGQKLQYRLLYRVAGKPRSLPWHQDEPPEPIRRRIERLEGPGRVLDLGCGAGVFAVWLARRGFAVTAVDYTPQAVRLAREHVQASGLPVRVLELDVTAPVLAGESFDLVLDVGCLHSLGLPPQRAAYRTNLLGWLAKHGEYLLVHGQRMHALDWRPFGPRRLPAGRIPGLFAPELCVRHYERSIEGVALPLGPRLELGYYALGWTDA